MKNLFIMGTAGSGKTAIALGIALKLKKEGYKVSYFKPVGRSTKVIGKPDADGVLMKNVLGIKAPLDTIVPHNAGPNYLSSYGSQGHEPCPVDRIMAAYNDISREADVVIVDGTVFPYAFAACNMDSVSLAKELDAHVLLVVKIKNDFSFDATVFFQEHLNMIKTKYLGCIFNNVPRPYLSKTEGIYKPILEERNVKTLGIIPQRPEIASPTVAEYLDLLEGEILTGEDRLHLPVEDVTVGAMSIESAISYLRRTANKAFIVGGDRSDLALAALETHTSVLILTGGLYPNVKVISRAAEKGVPVILVHYDTYTTVERLSRVFRQIRFEDKVGINVALENIEKYCLCDDIIGSLNLKPTE